MKIFSKFLTVNISKPNFWLVICIAKSFIWTTLKMIFSIFRFFCSLRFQIFKLLYFSQRLSDPNKPNINRKLIYSAFRLCIHLNVEKLTLKTGFVVQGHILGYYYFIFIIYKCNQNITWTCSWCLWKQQILYANWVFRNHKKSTL